ncbi:peptidoglycan DD-metalloendopeptidase family protein [Blautia sp. CLA-JM-H16]|uniref:Peptidoglycan DD-metalloendopeptidase family protein n=1 Tax=Blautia aquisgranensis TaxID=3133153 RepID=A0ABV1BHC9_9FIRM
MKSKIVRGIINGGVLAAVAALGITVYQLGTKPIVENPQEENSVQMEETGLEEELADGEEAAVSGDGRKADSGIEKNQSDAEEIAGGNKTAGKNSSNMSGDGAVTGSTESAITGADADLNRNAGDQGSNGATSATGAVNAGENSEASVAGTGESTETSATGIAAQNLNFTENSLMEWPVRGTVLIDYNMNETVYYPTLDQYRVSPAIAVQAVEDAPVYAAADGQVLSVEQDACTGTTVTMELGNGYQAVYGQLKDLTVEAGDSVKEGEVIGNISSPTKYYSVEGPNLYFAVKKDGVPVDPFEYLE